MLSWLPWLLKVWRRLPRPLQGVYLRLRYAHFAIGVNALIRDREGRVLLVRRTYVPSHPWALPGGWLERGDDFAATVERELAEETGLRVRAGRVIATTCSGYQVGVLLEAHLLRDGSVDDFRSSAEVDAIGWFALQDLPRIPRHDRRLLALASQPAD